MRAKINELWPKTSVAEGFLYFILRTYTHNSKTKGRIDRFHHVREVTLLIDLPTRLSFWCTRDDGYACGYWFVTTVLTAISPFRCTEFLPWHLTKENDSLNYQWSEELLFLQLFYEKILMSTTWRSIKLVRDTSFLVNLAKHWTKLI